MDGVHAALPYCLAVVNSRDFDGSRVPLALVGPKGTGKTTLARQIAEQLSRAVRHGVDDQRHRAVRLQRTAA